MKEQVVADFSGLPLHGMATASPTWWGTLAFMLIEGTGFALAIAVYLYLMSLAPTWPIDAPRPGPPAGNTGHAGSDRKRRSKLSDLAVGRTAGSAQGPVRHDRDVAARYRAADYPLLRISGIERQLGQQRLRLDRLD